MASVNGTSGLAMGNVLGSNIMNILLIVGIAAIIRPIHVQRKTLRLKFHSPSGSSCLVLGAEHMLKSADSAMLSRLDGVILSSDILPLHVQNIAIYQSSQNPKSEAKPVIAILLTVAGIAGLTRRHCRFGNEIAGRLGAFDAISGSLWWLGTSLPELVTSSVAAYKETPILP